LLDLLFDFSNPALHRFISGLAAASYLVTISYRRWRQGGKSEVAAFDHE
jgi:hypothetical protein